MTVTSSPRLRPGHLLRTAALAAVLGLPFAVPAGAQGFSDRILSPDAIERSLERRGFLDIDRPRLRDDVYVVTGINPRGDRVRLMIDAFNGEVVSRDRLEEALRPPRDIGPDFGEGRPRFRPDSVERRYEEYDDEDFPPRRRLGRIEVEREEVPPPVARLAPPVERPIPHIERPAAPAERPAPQRQTRRVDPLPSTLNPDAPKERRATATAPAQATKPSEAKPREAAPASISPKAPAEKAPAEVKTGSAPQPPAEAKPGASPQPPVEAKAGPSPQPAADAKAGEGPARTVRVIQGVTPVLPQASEAPKPAQSSAPAQPPAAAPSVAAQEPPATSSVKTD